MSEWKNHLHSRHHYDYYQELLVLSYPDDNIRHNHHNARHVNGKVPPLAPIIPLTV